MKRNTIKTTVIFIGQQQRKKDWCPVNKTVSAYDCVSPLYFFFLLKYEETASGSFDSEAEKKNTFCVCFDSEAEKNKFSALSGYRKVHRTFLHPYPPRIGPRFPGNCSAHRALDFLRKSLGLEKPNLNPSAAA